jgi:TnpA family transposase
MRDDLLRVAASVKGGHRTVYAARYLVDETYRRRIGRQLNKGENVHSLKRMLTYAGTGRSAARTTSSRPSRCGA